MSKRNGTNQNGLFHPFSSALLLFGAVFALSSLWGQNSAISSHYNFYPSPLGDITISEVRVPTAGVARSTYYESLGFWGNKGNSTGNGYGGIQESGDSRGNKVHIFSIWHAMNTDQVKDTSGYPYAAHLGYGMFSETFGGEGVGRKTWFLTKDPSHPLYWKPDVWYTHLVRAWNVGNDTHYGFFVRDGASGVWRHLSTIGVHEPNIRISGANDAFIEDWSSTGTVRRETNIRNNWRRGIDGKWTAAQNGSYSVNSWDFEDGKRSANFRYNWDGGVASDATGPYYYMISGGNSTRPTAPLNYPNKLSNSYYITNSATAPGHAAGRLALFSSKELSGNRMEFSWALDSLTLPQFGYTIEVFDNPSFSGSALLSKSRSVPQIRRDTLSISTLQPDQKKYYARMRIVDIFDAPSGYQTLSFGSDPVSSSSTTQVSSSSSSLEQNSSSSGEILSSSEEGTQIAALHLANLCKIHQADRLGMALTIPAGEQFRVRVVGITGRLQQEFALEGTGDVVNHRWARPLPAGVHFVTLQSSRSSAVLQTTRVQE